MSYHIEVRKVAFSTYHMHGLKPLPHIHSDVELVYLIKGSSVAVLDNREYVIKAGDLFLAFPNQIHYYLDKEPVEGYLMIFSLDLLKELQDVFRAKVPECAILGKDELPDNVEAILQNIHEKNRCGETLSKAIAKGNLLALLGECLCKMELVEKPGEQEAIKRILSYISEHYTEHLSLEVLAKELYLNKYYISHVFQERMNMTYKEFIHHLRVEYACELLRKGVSVTETAYASGFSTVRTFNRVFMKHKHITPKEYRYITDWQ